MASKIVLLALVVAMFAAVAMAECGNGVVEGNEECDNSDVSLRARE